MIHEDCQNLEETRKRYKNLFDKHATIHYKERMNRKNLGLNEYKMIVDYEDIDYFNTFSCCS